MKATKIYEHPTAELVEVKMERNIMSDRSSSAPDQMDTVNEDVWGGWA